MAMLFQQNTVEQERSLESFQLELHVFPTEYIQERAKPPLCAVTDRRNSYVILALRLVSF